MTGKRLDSLGRKLASIQHDTAKCLCPCQLKRWGAEKLARRTCNCRSVSRPIRPNCRFLFCIENKGRTPLPLLELCIEKFAGIALPREPFYTHSVPWGLVLEKGPIWIRSDDALAEITAAEPKLPRTGYAQCSLSGVKRTCRFALQMPAYDPKRTFAASARGVQFSSLCSKNADAIVYATSQFRRPSQREFCNTQTQSSADGNAAAHAASLRFF
jgi:hypothetical protein